MPWLKATSATTPPTTSSLSDPGRALALVAADDLGFVLWHDGGGAAWTRVGYPGGVEDGMQEMVDWALDESATLTQLEDVVWEWGQDERRHGRGA